MDNVDFLQDKKCLAICPAPDIQEPLHATEEGAEGAREGRVEGEGKGRTGLRGIGGGGKRGGRVGRGVSAAFGYTAPIALVCV